MEDEARWAAQLFDDAGMQYDKLRQDFARMQEEQNARMQQWQTAIYQADTRMLGSATSAWRRSLATRWIRRLPS